MLDFLSLTRPVDHIMIGTGAVNSVLRLIRSILGMSHVCLMIFEEVIYSPTFHLRRALIYNIVLFLSGNSVNDFSVLHLDEVLSRKRVRL